MARPKWQSFSSGMTLISMCMNLMQEQIAEKVSWVAEELGMKGDGNDEEVVKLSREVRTVDRSVRVSQS